MSDEAPPEKKEGAGVPAWVMTFADIMALLMCFFVLLLSFSEMDVLKFKQIAGSMQLAFGVQNEVKVRDIPKGTSIIKKEFSPGKPEKTPHNVVQQETIDKSKRQLDTDDNPKSEETIDQKQLAELIKQAQADASEITEQLEEQLKKGLIEIETKQQRVIIRVKERGSFPSGSSTLIRSAESVIAQIGDVLKSTPGQIIVAGHTDDIPINTARFRSNWELSAARAVTVVHHLLRVDGMVKSRFLIEGHADSRPLELNDSKDNRARNRRVEIVIVKGFDLDGGEIRGIPPAESESQTES